VAVAVAVAVTAAVAAAVVCVYVLYVCIVRVYLVVDAQVSCC